MTTEQMVEGMLEVVDTLQKKAKRKNTNESSSSNSSASKSSSMSEVSLM